MMTMKWDGHVKCSPTFVLLTPKSAGLPGAWPSSGSHYGTIISLQAMVLT